MGSGSGKRARQMLRAAGRDERQVPGRQNTGETIVLVDYVKVDDAFAETLAPDGSERLLHRHVCFQQRLIHASMSRDRVVKMGQCGRIGHAVALQRRMVNANGSFESKKAEGREKEKLRIRS